MRKEQIEEGGKIILSIKKAEFAKSKAAWMISEGVAERECVLHLTGQDSIIIPASLFKAIGKLAFAEYTNKISELNKQLEEL